MELEVRGQAKVFPIMGSPIHISRRPESSFFSILIKAFGYDIPGQTSSWHLFPFPPLQAKAYTHTLTQEILTD